MTSKRWGTGPEMFFGSSYKVQPANEILKISFTPLFSAATKPDMLRSTRKSHPSTPLPGRPSTPTPLRRTETYYDASDSRSLRAPPYKKCRTHNRKAIGQDEPIGLRRLGRRSVGQGSSTDSETSNLPSPGGQEMQVDGDEQFSANTLPEAPRSEEPQHAVVEQPRAIHPYVTTASRAQAVELGDALQAKKMIEALTLRVARLERREHTLLRLLAIKREVIKEAKATAEAAQRDLVLAEETISRRERALEEAKVQWERYQRWWLVENRSLKMALEKVPVTDLEELQHIVSSSQARFAVYLASAL
ncbi:hypothetical protein NMY22_g11871 [Coprinellus aureogranulatus]|nr:hypothetical protein NMY22_g11871 [Coprinellus aureogranulatus]